MKYPALFNSCDSSRFVRLLLAALLFVVTSSPAIRAQPAPPAGAGRGSIEGVVVDRDTRRALAGAVILVEGTERVAVTADDGRFRIDAVDAGVVVIRAESIGYLPLTYPEVKVSIGRAATIVLELVSGGDALRDQVTVTAAIAPRPPYVTTSSHSLVTEEVRRSAGSLGDVSRFVQALPGLAPVGDAGNDLVVRGGSPGENLTLVDGIEVPNLNHFNSQGSTGGAVSMLNNELIEGATFLAGAFPSQYGNRLSSVLDLHLREGNRTRPTLEADVNFVAASVIAEGPLGRRGSWLVCGRRSYFDLLLDGETTLVPRTSSFTTKVVYDLDSRNKLTFLSLGGVDSIRLDHDEDDLEEPSLLDQDLHGSRIVTGATWQRLIGARAVSLVTVSDAITTYDANIRDRAQQHETVLFNASTEGETTIRYDLSWQGPRGLHLRGGGTWKRLRRDLRVLQPIGVEQPWSAEPGRVPGIDLDVQAAAQIGSGYVEGSIDLLPRLTLIAGTRADYFERLDRSAISPHTGLELAVTPVVTLSVGAGRYHQQPDLLSIVAHPSNGTLLPMQADHVVTGVALAPRPGLRITVEGYVKRTRQYPVSLDYPALTLANQAVGFDRANSDLVLPLVSEGRGRSRGIEVMVKQQLWRGIYGQIAYSLSRTEQAALDGVMRRGRYDTPHVLTVIGGYRLGQRWELSGRFTAASGHPYRPPLLPQSVEQNRWIYDLSRVNAERTPAYHRLDARVDRRFTVFGRQLALFVELQNAYGRRGATDWTWNAKTRAPYPVRQVQLLPILGFNIEL